MTLSAIGGFILVLSGVLFFVVLVRGHLARQRPSRALPLQRRRAPAASRAGGA